jgi:anaerobic selenocysteine-containing dehydrogenase
MGKRDKIVDPIRFYKPDRVLKPLLKKTSKRYQHCRCYENHWTQFEWQKADFESCKKRYQCQNHKNNA